MNCSGSEVSDRLTQKSRLRIPGTQTSQTPGSPRGMNTLVWLVELHSTARDASFDQHSEVASTDQAKADRKIYAQDSKMSDQAPVS